MQPEKDKTILSTTKSPKHQNKKKNKWVVQESQNEQYKQSKINSTQKGSMQYPDISKFQEKYIFNIDAMIGNGFASSVYMGEEISSQRMVCIKAIDLMTLSRSSTKATQLLNQQMESMKKFKNSEYIVNLLDIYQSPTFYYIVMELCQGGDLYKMLKLSTFQLPVFFVNNIISQIAQGLSEIHSNSLIHRDLKTQNILIVKYPQTPTDPMKVKLGDLGFCISKQQISSLQEKGQKALNLGSPIYMCPQIALKHQYSEASDIYALGIIWYELLHKKAPWQALTQKQLLQKKLKQEIKVWRSDLDQTVKEMIAKILAIQPESRPKLTQIKQFLKPIQKSQ